MTLPVQLMLGVALAAGAGLRAWLPLFVVGLLARTGQIDLNVAFDFLSRTDALVVFGVATVLEFLGDKIVAVDHFLDTLGTFVRPVVGTLLASSMLVSTEPLTATVVGIVTGGGAALTVHTGKALARIKATATLPLHGGTYNAALSLSEDFIVGAWLWIAMHNPWVAFLIALLVLALAVWLIVAMWRSGRKLLGIMARVKGWKRQDTPKNSAELE
jgi:hypothetical protein